MATIQDTDEVIFTGYPKRMLVWDKEEDIKHEEIIICKRPKMEFPYVSILTSLNISSFRYAKDIPEKTVKDLKVGDTFSISPGGKTCTIEFISGNILIYSYTTATTGSITVTTLLSELERINIIID